MKLYGTFMVFRRGSDVFVMLPYGGVCAFTKCYRRVLGFNPAFMAL